MLVSALVAFLHFLAAFGIFATLFYEWLNFGRTPSLVDARRLQRCDMVYGLLAGLVIIAGLLRVLYFEKGSDFYLDSPFFHLKLGLFILVGLLSVYPTIVFLSWRKDVRAGHAPVVSPAQYTVVRVMLALELALLLAVILCASLMSKGIGMGAL